MKSIIRASAAVAAAACAFAFATSARADGPVVIQNPPPQPVAQPVVVANTGERGVPEYEGPNRAMLTSGLVTFGISYGIGVVVAASSTHYGDSHLYVPIAGPWIDIADRGSCGPALSTSCDNETANKVGLAVDGVFQAVGALSIIGAFIWPEEHERVTVAKHDKPEIHVAPTTGRNGTGLAVFGTF